MLFSSNISPILKPKSSPKLSPKLSPKPLKEMPAQAKSPLEIRFKLESPPLVCYGTPRESTGALLSGLLFVSVNAYQLAMRSVTLKLVQEVMYKRPMVGACRDCITEVNVLKSWDLLSHPCTLSKSEYGYPFSHLLAGDLPATTASALANVSYYLKAEAVAEAKDVRPVTLVKKLPLYRSHVSTDIRKCLRVFPPTELTVSASLPATAFPKSHFMSSMRLNNINNKDKKTRWRLKKLNWRLDEIAKGPHHGCKQHTSSPAALEDIKTISSDSLKDGWKTDFDNEGHIDIEVEISTLDTVPVCCNVSDPGLGVSVEHFLVIEMLVAEEITPATGQHVASPTGAARILRMQFSVDITERGGLGIAWDDEVPPTYEDVPISPPGYSYIVDTADIDSLMV
ncbi:uncharacterized protein V1510DRAFT_422783 [Dipodascopsis tothii]|uniref:uncharacterized protein n=1 Tax=Dipodascopsis tothii TaxID=44089 RepID=UPI0034CD2940